MANTSFDKDKLLEIYNPTFAMAYGSGIFKQNEYSKKDRPMLDFVFGVDNTNWHIDNFIKNSTDYSLIMRKIIKRSKPENTYEGLLGRIQNSGAGVFYNALVPFEDKKIKYGVILTNTLINDLENWNSLYISGRLHKPALILQSNTKINDAININLEHAVNVALLLLGEKFTKDEFGIMITSLSYLGDSRGVFENPKKVINIYESNKEGFDKLYRKILEKKCEQNIITISNGVIIKNTNPYINESIIQSLPKTILENEMFKKYESTNIKKALTESISSIVNHSSKVQTMKGLLTAGPIKSAKYVGSKAYKGLIPRIKKLINK